MFAVVGFMVLVTDIHTDNCYLASDFLKSNKKGFKI